MKRTSKQEKKSRRRRRWRLREKESLSLLFLKRSSQQSRQTPEEDWLKQRRAEVDADKESVSLALWTKEEEESEREAKKNDLFFFSSQFTLSLRSSLFPPFFLLASRKRGKVRIALLFYHLLSQMGSSRASWPWKVVELAVEELKGDEHSCFALDGA